MVVDEWVAPISFRDCFPTRLNYADGAAYADGAVGVGFCGGAAGRDRPWPGALSVMILILPPGLIT